MPTVSSQRSSSVSLYLQEISAYSLLTKNQELAIARRIPEEKRSGRNDAAFHHLVRSHLGFVVKVAREYRNMGLSFEDLLGEGNLGLIEAANHFDPGRGTRFITYAVWWIRKSILRALSRQGATVRVPSYQLKKVRQVREAGRRLTHALGREADREEISRELRTDVETIDEILQVKLRKLSLEDRVGGAEDAPISSHLVDRSSADPEAELIKNDTRRRIRAALGNLNDRDLTVIVNRFGLGGGRMFTLREIAGRMGISRERVRQIESEARTRLRRAIARPVRSATPQRPGPCGSSSGHGPADPHPADRKQTVLQAESADLTFPQRPVVIGNPALSCCSTRR